jgi:hypothetical protein
MSAGKGRSSSRGWLFGVVGIAAAVATVTANAASTGPAAVVEIFQRHGCSSGPPTHADILTLPDHADLFVKRADGRSISTALKS